MDKNIEKTVKEIVTEATVSGKAGITPDDLTNIKSIVNMGYTTKRLEEIILDENIRSLVYSERIADIEFDVETVAVLNEALKYAMVNPSAVKSVEQKDPVMKAIKLIFREDQIDGVVLMQNNSIAVYRKGVQLPSTIFCRSAMDSESIFDQLVKDIKKQS